MAWSRLGRRLRGDTPLGGVQSCTPHPDNTPSSTLFCHPASEMLRRDSSDVKSAPVPHVLGFVGDKLGFKILSLRRDVVLAWRLFVSGMVLIVLFGIAAWRMPPV